MCSRTGRRTQAGTPHGVKHTEVHALVARILARRFAHDGFNFPPPCSQGTTPRWSRIPPTKLQTGCRVLAIVAAEYGIHFSTSSLVVPAVGEAECTIHLENAASSRRRPHSKVWECVWTAAAAPGPPWTTE